MPLCLVSAHQLFSVTKHKSMRSRACASVFTAQLEVSRATHCHSRTLHFADRGSVCRCRVLLGEQLVWRAPRKSLRRCQPPGNSLRSVLRSVAMRADAAGLGEALLPGSPSSRCSGPAP